MRTLRSQARKLNLLFVLELLDEEVRQSVPNYVGSLTQQAVAEAIRRARRQPRRTAQTRTEDKLLIS